jgi:uncharacterized RDD family membrane protein YckC
MMQPDNQSLPCWLCAARQSEQGTRRVAGSVREIRHGLERQGGAMETLVLSERERGIQALRDGDPDSAARLLREAVGVGARDAETYGFLGIACSQTGQHEEAVRVLQAAIDLQPSEPRYRFNLGVALQDAGDLEGAAAAYRELLRRFPGHPQARARLRDLQPAAAAAGSVPTAPWLQMGYGLPDLSLSTEESAATVQPMPVGEAFWRRTAASLVDGVIVLVMMLVVGVIIGPLLFTAVGSIGGSEAVRAVLPVSLVLNQLATLIITWLYFVGPQGRYGQTVGKMLLGIRLVGPDGGIPGMVRVGVREIALKYVIPLVLLLMPPIGVLGLILLLPADCLWMLCDARQQTWHDRIAGTRVERA